MGLCVFPPRFWDSPKKKSYVEQSVAGIPMLVLIIWKKKSNQILFPFFSSKVSKFQLLYLCPKHCEQAFEKSRISSTKEDKNKNTPVASSESGRKSRMTIIWLMDITVVQFKTKLVSKTKRAH